MFADVSVHHFVHISTCICLHSLSRKAATVHVQHMCLSACLHTITAHILQVCICIRVCVCVCVCVCGQ